MSLETQHRIVEALSITGADPVTKAFLKLAGASEEVAKALGHQKEEAAGLEGHLNQLEKDWFNKPEKVTRPPKEGVTWWNKFKKAAGEATGPMFKQFALASLLEKALGFALAKLGQMLQRGWQINEAFEAARGRVQGMALGLMDFGKVSDTEKLRKSIVLANVLMAEFKDIAMDAATPVPEIEAAYTRLNSILAGTGRNQAEIVRETRLAASAAKVYGEKAEQAAGIVAKAIFEGNIEGETAFARALKAQANINSKMSREERFKKVNKVLEQMAGAVGVVTANTAGAMARWDILTTDILQRVTLPIYEKIGGVIGSIVSAMETNEAIVDATVTEVQEWWHAIGDVTKGVWNVVAGAFEVWVQIGRWKEKGSLVLDVLKFVRQTVGLIGGGLELAVEWVRSLVDPDRGVGKLATLSESIKVKWFEIADTILGVVDSLAKLVIPEKMRNLPGIRDFFKSLGETRFSLQIERDMMAKRLRQMEKSMGLDATTESTRALKAAEDGIGLDKKARDELLRNTKGLKIEQNIDTIEIYQDFRDQDPDHVIVEFVTDLERIGENALQSTVAGGTEFESGSSF